MLSALANIIIAFTTFVGVVAAVAYYMKEIQNITLTHIFLAEAVYVISAIIIILWNKSTIK